VKGLGSGLALETLKRKTHSSKWAARRRTIRPSSTRSTIDIATDTAPEPGLPKTTPNGCDVNMASYGPDISGIVVVRKKGSAVVWRNGWCGEGGASNGGAGSSAGHC
jgi:hypothetical protein